MPTLLRFRNFRIVIFVDDHDPPHVHAFGPGRDVSFYLNGPDGPVTLRNRFRTRPAEERALRDFIAENLDMLCAAWKEIEDERNQ